MDNEIKGLRSILADVLDALASNERAIAGLQISITAARLALHDVSPDRFEQAYAQRFAELEAQGINQSSAEHESFFLALAQRLRSQS